MSLRSRNSPTYARYSREGFQPLNPADATIDIPLGNFSNPQHAHFPNASPERNPNEELMQDEKDRTPRSRGKRRSMRPESRMSGLGYDGQHDTINKMGMFYEMLLKSSIVVRYIVYIFPLGLMLAAPMIAGAFLPNATIGGVRIVWFFMWLLISWVGLWVSKLVAHFLPLAFQFLAGIVSSGTRKYALVLRALEIQLSLTGWALISLATFKPIMTRNPDTRHADAAYTQAHPGQTVPVPSWQNIVQSILAAWLICMVLFLAERVLIQLVSINYHRKQFDLRIRDSKERVAQITALYASSRQMFPAFCAEFAEEDAVIADTIDLILTRKKGGNHKRSGSNTPGRVLRDVSRIGDKLTTAFGNVAHEITGKNVFNPNSSHSVVVEALEKNRSCEALGRRLWLSFVVEGHEALYVEDIIEVFGLDRRAEAEECFAALDVDGNGDVSLDEMIQTITEIGRERRAVANSMHDVDAAINVLDSMLVVVVLIASAFIFVAFLNKSFVTTLATAGTTLLSLSFIFSVTAQEVLGSCVFLFVKHPLDVSDTVYLNGASQSATPDQLIVEHVSLLYTVFKRVNSGRLVQIPNQVLNTYWIENISRSKAMREQLSIFVDFGTTFEDIQLLRNEMSKFVTDKENARDFQPHVEIEVIGIGNMDKLELRVEIQHKSNWANESIRASRRSRFMCALVLALRKVPIYGPSGSGPALGEMGNPSYSVAIPDDMAARKRDAAAKEKEAKRMMPIKTLTAPSSEATLSPTMSEKGEFASRVDNMKTTMIGAPLAPIQETRAINQLHERDPGQDTARDSGTFRTSGMQPTQGRRGSEVQDLEEVRGMLRRATTKGRRRSGTTTSTTAPGRTSGQYNQAYTTSSNTNTSGMGPTPFAIQSAPAAPYMYGATPSAPAYQHEAQTGYREPGEAPGDIPEVSEALENVRPPPQAAIPSAGRHELQDDENDLRGENEDEMPYGGQPKMTAGGAWSAQQWRTGL